MRYAAPVAMPAGLGEWLGAELEARGVEAASLYARAVLSILLHSENDVDLMERELEEQQQHFGINPRAALELELRLERHNKEKEARRSRTGKRCVTAATTPNVAATRTGANSGHPKYGQRSSNMTSSHRVKCSAQSDLTRRRPHSWNGDGEELKKCAAIECLLSATDDDQWPVEKLVDELCARLKLLQLEQQNEALGRSKKLTGLGSSAPECFDGPSSDSDSFTSVSSPDIEPENYYQAFPPLEYLSDCEEQKVDSVPESIWDVRSKVKSPAKSNGSSYSNGTTKNRVPFVRMTGARLSPAPSHELQHLKEQIQAQQTKCAAYAPCSASVPVPQLASSCGDTSEAYFGDCSRDSSVERALTPPLALKGRLYERGPVQGWGLESTTLFSSSPSIHGRRLSHELDKALKSLTHVHEEVDGQKPLVRLNPAELGGLIGEGRRRAAEWEEWGLQSGLSNIWAPLESDWALIRSDPDGWPTPVAGVDLFPIGECSSAGDRVTNAVQLSLALLNHHPEISSFTPVLPLKSSSDIWTAPGGSGTSSKLMEWLVGLDPVVPLEEADGEGDEKEVESILKEEAAVAGNVETENGPAEPEDDEENLLTSPKTHFCPIQLQEGDVEVKVKDGATFQVDAQPEEVHFLRSPSGALYLPQSEDNGDGWKGWAKYMVYKTPTSPSPALLEANEPADATTSPRPASPFTLKFRVVQTEKCCQTDLALVDPTGCSGNDADDGAADETTPPLAISSPFVSPFSSGIGTRLLDPDADVWKFDAQAVSLKDLRKTDAEETAAEDCESVSKDANVDEELDVKEEVDGLLNEVWNVTVVQDTSIAVREEEPEEAIPDSPEVQPEAEEMASNAWFARYQHQQPVDEDDAAKKEFEYLDELWNPLMSDGGEDQIDVCEWIPQPYDEDGMAGEDDGISAWAVGEVGADSWPPPNIPVEYLDDEFFDEIYGSLDSKASDPAGGGGGGAGGGGGKSSRRHCRRRRRNSQKVPPAQRRRPCSFFVEGECRRPDCKFSHDLGSITCRFWIESSCFKGDACPFLHGLPVKEVRDSHQSKNFHGHRHYPSDVELSEGCNSASEEAAETAPSQRLHQRKNGGPNATSSAAGKKKFQFDLEADFPCLSVDSIKPVPASAPVAAGVGSRSAVSQSRPIPIAGVSFATADNTGSSLENGGANDCGGGAAAGGVKRRRRKFPSQRVAAAVSMVGTSSESSPGEMTVSTASQHHNNATTAGKRSRKVAKVITVGFQQPAATSAITGSSSNNKKDRGKAFGQAGAEGDPPSERRRTKSEHDPAQSAPVISATGSGNSSSAGSGGRADGISRLRLSSSYKEG